MSYCLKLCRRFTFIGLLLVGVTGCRGERLTSVVEQPTAEGRWRADGLLIRSYNVTLGQAVDSITDLAQRKRWLIVRVVHDEHTADVDVKTSELVEINFDIWAPAGKATDIGVEYGGGNRIGSIRVFDDLERVLPGKRITVNQPQ